MRYFACAALISSGLLLSPAASAQEKLEESEPNEIVVTGTRDLDQQVSDFVGAIAPAPPRGQLARFEWGVCPAVVGLSADQKIAIEQRLRTVAKAAGIPVAEAGCAPNALVMLTGAKGPFIDALMRRRPEYFGELSTAKLRRLQSEPGRATAWQLQGQVTGRGTPMERGAGVAVNRTTDGQSRITAAARPVFEAAAVVVEMGALEGLTTIQLADYAAMRLFARTDPSRLAGSKAPTILNILDAPMGSEIPITLTKWDLEFLRGLYASPANLYAGSQRSAIGRQIKAGLAQPDEDTEGPSVAKDSAPEQPR